MVALTANVPLVVMGVPATDMNDGTVMLTDVTVPFPPPPPPLVIATVFNMITSRLKDCVFHCDGQGKAKLRLTAYLVHTMNDGLATLLLHK